MNQRILNLITYYREYRDDPAWEAYLTEQHTQRITGIWQGDYKGVPIDEWNVVIDGSKVVIYDAKEMHETQVYLIPSPADTFNYDGPKVPVPDFMPLFRACDPAQEQGDPLAGERETDEAEVVKPDHDAYQQQREREHYATLDAIEDERDVQRFWEENGVEPAALKPADNPKLIAGVTTDAGDVFIAYRWMDGVELSIPGDYFRFSRGELQSLQYIIDWLQQVQSAFTPAAQGEAS